MRRGFTGFLFVAAALATAAPAQAGEGGLSGAAGEWTGLTAAQPRQIAAQSSCTCRRGRWIVTSSPGYTYGKGRRMCQHVYRRSKVRGARLARYHPATGRCYICYRGNVICPRGTRVGDGSGTRRVPPRKKQFQPSKDRWRKVPKYRKAQWKHDMNCRPGGGWRRWGVNRGRCFYCPPNWGWTTVPRSWGYYENVACRRFVRERY